MSSQTSATSLRELSGSPLFSAETLDGTGADLFPVPRDTPPTGVFRVSSGGARNRSLQVGPFVDVVGRNSAIRWATSVGSSIVASVDIPDGVVPTSRTRVPSRINASCCCGPRAWRERTSRDEAMRPCSGPPFLRYCRTIQPIARMPNAQKRLGPKLEFEGTLESLPSSAKSVVGSGVFSRTGEAGSEVSISASDSRRTVVDFELVGGSS